MAPAHQRRFQVGAPEGRSDRAERTMSHPTDPDVNPDRFPGDRTDPGADRPAGHSAPSGHRSTKATEKAQMLRSLFREHYASLCHFAVSLLDRWAEAEDVVQETFVQLWSRHRERLPLENAEAYLFRAVRNASYNRLQSARAVRRDADGEVDVIGRSSARPPDAAVSHKETQAAVDAALQRLSPRQEDVYRLSRHHDLTYAQIAGVLDVSIKTVETHMGRALATLRDELKTYRGEDARD